MIDAIETLQSKLTKEAEFRALKYFNENIEVFFRDHKIFSVYVSAENSAVKNKIIDSDGCICGEFKKEILRQLENYYYDFLSRKIIDGIGGDLFEKNN